MLERCLIEGRRRESCHVSYDELLGEFVRYIYIANTAVRSKVVIIISN